jgi:Fis family transcriptional regulator
MRRELESAVTLMQQDGVNYEAAVRTFKRLFIVMMLERCRGNKCKAAREMGMHRNTIRRIMDDLKIEREPHETESAA